MYICSLKMQNKLCRISLRCWRFYVSMEIEKDKATHCSYKPSTSEERSCISKEHCTIITTPDLFYGHCIIYSSHLSGKTSVIKKEQQRVNSTVSCFQLCQWILLKPLSMIFRLLWHSGTFNQTFLTYSLCFWLLLLATIFLSKISYSTGWHQEGWELWE